MLVYKRIIWLRGKIAEQRTWIEEHGGDLKGYIDRYGDPAPVDEHTDEPVGPYVPPKNELGLPKVIRIEVKDADMVADMLRVHPDFDLFYAQPYGHGGTAIYKADSAQLHKLEDELRRLCINDHAAMVKANEVEAAKRRKQVKAASKA